MKRALVALSVCALFAAPAFAQQSLEQPRMPDDGVGVDYSQPYVNDLLLRARPLVDGLFVGTRRRESCEKQRLALAEDPLDPALDQAYETCAKDLEQSELNRLLSNNDEYTVTMPNGDQFVFSRNDPRGPLWKGGDFLRGPWRPEARPFVPDPDAPPAVRPAPLSPSHPNAQN